MAILAVSVLFFIMIVSIILLSVTYVLQSIALMEIGKRKGEENSWLAWIPFARDYFFGKVAYGDNKNSIIYISVLYGARFASILISVIISSLLILLEEPELANATINLVMNIVLIGLNVYTAIVAGKIYKMFTKDSIPLTVLTALLPISMPIILFIFRKKDFIIEGKTV